MPQYIDNVQPLWKQSIMTEFNWLPMGILAVGMVVYYNYRPCDVLRLARSVPAQVTVGPHPDAKAAAHPKIPHIICSAVTRYWGHVYVVPWHG